jgi:hypothetical protein
MAHARPFPLVLALALAACATAPVKAPRPQRGVGVVEIASSPEADWVALTRQQPPLKPEETPLVVRGADAAERLELAPGKYKVELSREGGRYGYDLSVDVRELERQRLAVELRSSPAERVQPVVFAGIGAGITAGLAAACGIHPSSQACAGAAGVAALTGVVGWFAWKAWHRDGRLVASERVSLRGAVAEGPAEGAPPAAQASAPAARGGEPAARGGGDAGPAAASDARAVKEPAGPKSKAAQKAKAKRAEKARRAAP